MIPAQSRFSLAPLAALSASALVLAVAAGTGRGQPPAGAAERKNEQPPALKRTFISTLTCVTCHTQGPFALPEGAPERLPKLVLQTEYKTWNEEDKHHHAFDALRGDRGKAMGKALGFADVSLERACLSCHASGFERDDPEQKLAVEARELGVGCTSCHGPYEEWTEKHYKGIAANPAWREMPPETKREMYGMTDLREPSVRAKVCSSCHVGNASEGKVVTHAMYAAGHPPLPAVELASFLKTMPPHWVKPTDVDAFQKDADLREKNHIDFNEPQATRDTVIGGVVALGDAMRLLANRTEPEPTPLGHSSKTWPDYAQLECYACHHDLRVPEPDRGRQARGFDHHFDGLVVAGVPGRPQFRPWPLALVRLAIAQTGTGRDTYREAVKELYAALDARPFGDPARVSRAAKRVADWSEEMLGKLQSTHFDASSPRKLLAVLAATPVAEVADYDSAREVAWAIQTLYSDWQETRKPENDAAFTDLLSKIDATVKLDPYSTRAPRTRLIISKKETGDALRAALLTLSEEEFHTSLARAADFDPKAFQEELRQLGVLLAGAGQ